MPLDKLRTDLAPRQLQALIREESTVTSNVIFTLHVEQQMRKRNITKSAVLETLRRGVIRRTPEPNMMHGQVECLMEHYCSGHHIGVIVAISDDPGLVLITAMYTSRDKK